MTETKSTEERVTAVETHIKHILDGIKEIKSAIDKIDTKLDTKIDGLRTELSSKIDDTNNRIDSNRKELSDRMDKFFWYFIGGIVTIVATIIGAAFI